MIIAKNETFPLCIPVKRVANLTPPPVVIRSGLQRTRCTGRRITQMYGPAVVSQEPTRWW